MVPKTTENHSELHSGDIDLVRRVMEDMFIPLFLDDQAHHSIGFTHISRLIGEKLGWYLWTKDQKGAYLLELMGVEPVEFKIPHPFPGVAADFTLRYYPDPEEHSFENYALVERQARLGPFFDETGTPVFEKQNEIHESLFAVGNLHLAFDHLLRIATLKISAQDRWIEIHGDSLTIQHHSGQPAETIPKGDIDRSVPGWELTWHFFDKLLLGFCYVHKCFPVSLRLTKSPGFIYRVDGNHQVAEIRDLVTNRWTLETGIFLQSLKTLSMDLETLKTAFRESIPHSLEKGETMVNYFENPTRISPWIDSNWWKASSWIFQPSTEINHCCFKDHSIFTQLEDIRGH